MHPVELTHEAPERDVGVLQELAHLARDLQHHHGIVDGLAVDDGPPVEPPLADELPDEADPRRAPQPVPVAVARGLRDLLGVEPVEERLLADVQLASDLEGRDVLHPRGFSPPPPLASTPRLWIPRRRTRMGSSE